MYLSGWAIFFILLCLYFLYSGVAKAAREEGLREGRERGLWEATHHDFIDSDY